MMVNPKVFYKIFLSITFLIFGVCGCSGSDLFFKANLTSNKINNLFDINGDGKSDLLFFNVKSPDCFFEAFDFPNEKFQVGILGKVGDIPISGDFTGDGYFDYGVYKYASSGNIWNIFDGLTKSIFGNKFGEPGDLPVPSDYDGDGKFDFVIYRPKNSGFYGYLSNKNKYLEIHLGITGDIPVSRDYDGDGRADLAVYTSLGGSWSIKSSRNGLVIYKKLGGEDYIPIPGDYDGDKRADIAVWNYKNNDIKIIFSSSGQKLQDKIRLKIKETLGNKKYFPISLDFDGDGKSEIALWEINKNIIHFLKIKKDNLEHENHALNIENNSKPLNYYLFKRYMGRNNKISTSLLYKIFKTKNKLSGDFDGDFIKEQAQFNQNTGSFKFKLSSGMEDSLVSFSGFSGEPLVSDFDGDNRDDCALIDTKAGVLTYFSSALGAFASINLDPKLSGTPFAYDIDLDFKSDPIFYNEETNIFSFLRSSDSYQYGEVYL